MSTSSRNTFRYVRMALALCVGALLPLVLPQEPLELLHQDCRETLGHWCPLLDPVSNSFVVWRQNPLLSPPMEMLQRELAITPLQSAFLIYGLIFVAGLLAAGLAQSTLGLCAGALMLVLWVTSCRGSLITSAATAWIPAVMALLESKFLRSRPYYPFVVIFTGLLVTLSANQLAPLVLLCAYLCATVPVSDDEAEQPSVLKRAPILLLLLFIPLIALFVTPSPQFPSYPQNTQVVPDDEIPGMLRPFVGPLAPVPIIHRFQVKDFLAPDVLILGILVLVVLSATLRTNATGPRQRGWLVAAWGALAVDLLAPEAVSILAPLQVLARLQPHLSFFSLAGVILPLLVGILAGRIVQAGSLSRRLLVALLVLSLFSFTSLRLPHRVEPAAVAAWPTPEEYNRHLLLSTSPSRFVLESARWDLHGSNRNWLLEQQETIRTAAFIPLGRHEVTIQASQNPALIRALFSPDLTDRWTSGQGNQNGNEWLHLRFPEPRTLQGLELFLSSFVTDFPRGIRISTAASCEGSYSPEQRAQYAPVVEHPTWYGALEFTPEGFPFFRGRYDVRVYFPSSVMTSCVLVEQTANVPGSDWSIAQVRVLP